MLRDASELLYPAVMETLGELGLLGADCAAAKLARTYAKTIDQADGPKRASVLWHLGPELLKTLESLGATPAARAALARGARDKGSEKVKSQLDALREARSKRA